jgi:hypothetical protein
MLARAKGPRSAHGRRPVILIKKENNMSSFKKAGNGKNESLVADSSNINPVADATQPQRPDCTSALQKIKIGQIAA